jgi:hypothetical protein
MPLRASDSHERREREDGRTAGQRPQPPQHSHDGKWWWDGSRWVPVEQSVSTDTSDYVGHGQTVAAMDPSRRLTAGASTAHAVASNCTDPAEATTRSYCLRWINRG